MRKRTLNIEKILLPESRRNKMRTKKIMSIMLAIVMVFSNSYVVCASGNKIDADTLELEKAIENDINEIEMSLEMQGTSVCEGLDEAIEMLEIEKNQATNESDIDKIQALIDVTKELKYDYISYTNGIVPTGVENPVYSPMVAAVASFFSVNGYRLSYELLIHAIDNNDIHSLYTPVYGDRIRESSVTHRIMLSSTNTSGSAAYENTGNTAERDLYYSIHNFDYSFTASNHTFMLMDKYDYGISDEYSSVADVAVDAMYMAQKNGVIVPYYVKITIQ